MAAITRLCRTRTQRFKVLLDNYVKNRPIVTETRSIFLLTTNQNRYSGLRKYSVESADAKTLTNESVNYSLISYNISNLNRSIERVGRVFKPDVLDLFDVIKSGTPTSDKIVLLLRSCGSFLAEEIPAKRMILVQDIWKYVKNIGMELDVNIFNVLLRVYLENGHVFSPTEFLEEMKTHGTEPNKITYQRLIKGYCEVGDMKGAGNILQLMKGSDFPVGESVMNSLIQGHSRAKDMAGAHNMFNMMSGLNVEPTQASYTALLCGHAELNNSDKMKEIFRELEEKNIALNNNNKYAIIKSLAKGKNQSHIREILKEMQLGPKFTSIALNNVLDLLNHNYISAAYDVFASASEKTNGSIKPMFLKHLISHRNNDVNAETIIGYCRSMIKDNVDSYAFTTAIELSYLENRHEFGLYLLRSMHRDGVLLRPHYFWPAIVNAGKKGGKNDVAKVLQLMTSLGCPISQETAIDFIYPNIDTADPVQLVLFMKKYTKLSSTAICNSIVPFLFGQDRYDDAAVLVSRYPTDLNGRRNSKSLAIATKKHNIDSIVEIVKSLKPYLSENDKKADAHGEFLLHCLEQHKNDISKIEPVIKAMLSKKIFIAQSSLDSFKEKFGSEMSPELSELLQELVALDENLDFQYQYKLTYGGSDNESEEVAALEETYAELKEKGMYLNAILRKLIFAQCQQQNLDRVTELMKEFDDYGFKYSSALSSMIFQLFTRTSKIEAAIEFKKKLELTDPSFKNDLSQQFTFVTLLAVEGKLDDAISELKLIKDQHENINADDLHSHILKMLDIISARGETEKTLKMLNMAKEFKSFKMSRSIMETMMKSYIGSDDLGGALQFYKECSFLYDVCPLAKELMVQFIKIEDTENLKTVMNIFVKNRGERVSMHNLGFAFIECGKVDQAKKIFETPGIKALNATIDKIGEYYYRKSWSKALENLLTATENLKELDRQIIYSHLLNLYHKLQKTEAAKELTFKMHEENIKHISGFGKDFADEALVSAEALIKKSLVNNNMDEALELYKTAKKDSITSKTVGHLLTRLLESGRYDDLLSVLQEILPKQRINKRLLANVVNHVYEKSDFDSLYKLSQKLSPEQSQFVKMSTKLINTVTKNGGSMAFLDWIENDKDRIDAHFRYSAVLTLLQENPEIIDRAFSIAKDAAADRDNFAPLNIFWMYHFCAHDHEKVDKLIEEYPNLKNVVSYGPVIQRNLADEQLIKKLASTFEQYGAEPTHISRIKNAVVISLLCNDKPKEALSLFDELKRSEHFPALMTKLTYGQIKALQEEGKEIPSQIIESYASKFESSTKSEPKAIDDKDGSSSSSDSSSDDEVVKKT